jgi:hypothetical protein
MEEYYEDLKTDIENMRAQNELVRAALPPSAFTPQTIAAGQEYGGLIICDASVLNDNTEGRFQIAVSIAGEEHRFTFSRGLSDNKE